MLYSSVDIAHGNCITTVWPDDKTVTLLLRKITLIIAFSFLIGNGELYAVPFTELLYNFVLLPARKLFRYIHLLQDNTLVQHLWN